MAEEVSPEVIETTQSTLGKYVTRPQLTEKLLKKPPFRFLHDTVNGVIKETGFLKGLYSEGELLSDNVKDRDGKIAFLNKLISAVKTISGIDLQVRASKIIAGLEPTETNKLLQAIGTSIEQKLDSKEYVSQLKGKPSKSKSKEAEKTKKTATKTSVKSDKSNESTAKVKKVETPKSKTSVKAKDGGKETPKGKAAKTAKEPVKGALKTNKGDKKAKASKESPRDKKLTPKTSSPREAEKPVIKIPQVTKDDKDDEIVDESPKDFIEDVGVESSKLVEEEKGIEKKGEEKTVEEKKGEQKMRSAEDKKRIAEEERKKKIAEEERKAKILDEERKKKIAEDERKLIEENERKIADEEERKVAEEQNAEKKVQFTERKPSAVERPKSARPKSGDRNKENLIVERKPEPAAILRPKSSLRPPSVRPSSARPGAPRLRPDSALPMKEVLPMGKINVIVENFDIDGKDDDEEETVVIQNIIEEVAEHRSIEEVLDIPTDKGHLVEQILEQIQGPEQLEEQTSKGRSNWEIDNAKGKDATAKEINQLRASIQALTRTANPLGKLMSYLHEDVEAMHSELDTWTNLRRQYTTEINKQKRINADSNQPYINKLKQLEESIAKQQEEIAAVKFNILRGEDKIRDLVSKQIVTQ